MTRLCLALIRKRTNTNMQESACPREAFSYRLLVLRQDWNWTSNPPFLHRRRDPPWRGADDRQDTPPYPPLPSLLSHARTYLKCVEPANLHRASETRERARYMVNPTQPLWGELQDPCPSYKKAGKYIKTIEMVKTEIYCESHSTPIRRTPRPLPVF